MPHIHTLDGQHNITVSAYIVRMQDDEPLVLVHMHRKLGKLMQAGGHIELAETPWAALAHELAEETGYQLNELSVLQPTKQLPTLEHAVIHPVPLLVNTHRVNAEHYHSDLCYAFIARAIPARAQAEGEADDIRWLTLPELQCEVASGTALEDVYEIYTHIVTQCLERYEWVYADAFSIADPVDLVF